MNGNSLISIPFQRLCVKSHLPSRFDKGDKVLFFLSIFLQHKLEIKFNDGRQVRGILTSVTSDSIGIDGHQYRLAECSSWLNQCQVGVVVDSNPNMALVRIVPCRCYGIDHRESVYANLNDQQFSELSAAVFDVENDEDLQDCPVLYATGGGKVEIYGTGSPFPKVRFGSIERYIKNLGVGQIVPEQHGALPNDVRLRFAAEDLLNITPNELDTFSFGYNVSYTIGFLMDRTKKAENVYELGEVPLQLDGDPMQILYDCMEDASRRQDVSSEIVALEPLPENRQYGLLLYYMPDFQFVKLHRFYKSKMYGELTSEERKTAQLILISQKEGSLFPQETINTKDNVYLVSFNSEQQVEIHAVYEKKDIWMLRVEGNHLLIIRTSRKEQPKEGVGQEGPESPKEEELLSKQDVKEETPFIVNLPAHQNQAECYAFLNYYGRTAPMLYFNSVFAPGLTGDQAIRCTLARVEQENAQFVRDGENLPVEPATAFNTYKNTYVVRIMPEEHPRISGAPFVKGPVTIVRSFPRKNYRRLELEGDLIRAYGASGEGIVQLGYLPEEKMDCPEYVQGETLILLDGSGQHTVTFDADAGRLDGQATGQRFGLLTGLFRHPDGEALIGGCLNHRIYFDMANVGEQARNIIRSSPKQILLRYACTNGRVVVDRVTPELVWDIPWQKGTVTKCGNSAAELTVTVNDDIVHYQSTETDGYVNAAARNNALKNEVVFMKQIVCPDWQNEGSPRLMKIAVQLHCGHEKAIITYDDRQDQYYACRYNLVTKVVGNVRRIAYGDEKALAAAVNRHVDIEFQPYGDEALDLIPIMPPTGECEPGNMRMPSDVRQERIAASSKPNIYAEKTSMGRFMLRIAGNNPRYKDLLSDINAGALEDTAQSSQISSVLAGIFNSERWEDLTIAAKLLEAPQQRTQLTRLPVYQGSIPVNTHAFLRRALRTHLVELLQGGNYQIGEFVACLQTILDSDTSAEQRARDLYVYFLPSFSSRYELEKSALVNIMKASFASEGPESDQEFVKLLRDLFGNDAAEVDASRLLAQILALDESSFDYFCDITRDAISREIREKLLAECGAAAGPENMDRLLAALREKRLVYSGRKAHCLHLLKEIAHLDRERSVCGAIVEKQQELSSEFLPLLDKDDQNNLRELLKNCQIVESSTRKSYAEKMSELENAARNISVLKASTTEHPTLMMTELFQNTGLLERMHKDAVGEINRLCQDKNSLPDVRCVCDYPILVPSQSNFALILENGNKGSKAHRAIRNPNVSLAFVDGISEGNTVHKLKPKENELNSGGRTVLIAGIRLADADVGTTIRIDYTVTYQYLDSVQFDASHTYMIPSWKDGVAEGCVTLCVEEIPDSLRRVRQGVENPYKSIINRSLDADSSMYFGRGNEQKELLSYLCDDQKHLISGRTVLVYGQKQCGKTSFINRIRGELESGPHTLVLYYSDVYDSVCRSVPGALSAFMQKFYADLLEKLVGQLCGSGNPPLPALGERYGAKLRLWSDDILEEHGLEKTELFFRLLDDLRKIDQGQYKIVLIIDEFTRLCNAIRDCRAQHPEYRAIPEFVRSFSSRGFIQIIVGHDSMMQTLQELNIINRTAQTAKVMQLTALDDDASREMIHKPMEDIFEFDVYQTDSGKAAIRRLQDLSGCSPNYLAYLCDKMFQYYCSEGKPQMDEADVGGMLDKLAEADLKTTYMSLFDPLLSEDHDDSRMRDDIYTYLCDIAKLTYDREPHECPINTISEKLGSQRSSTIRDMLILRNVLSADKGMIRINVGLFREHVRKLYGR